jgi:hypothetical protein
VVADRVAAGEWERFTVGYHGVLVRMLLIACSFTVHCVSHRENTTNSNQISLRSSHGKHVCAEKERVVADRAVVGGWEQWLVTPATLSQSLNAV